MNPQQEYEARLSKWKAEAARHDARHLRVGNYRLLFLAALIVGAILLREHVFIGFLFGLIFAGIFITGYFHDRIIVARDQALAMAEFYQRGLQRMRGEWMGKGVPGTEFLNKEHPNAIDLDLFGSGSIFELLNTTQTESGRKFLAQWLLTGASSSEVLARQAAVLELRGKLDFRETLAGKMFQAKTQLRTESLLAWASRPPNAPSKAVRAMVFASPIVTWSLLAGWQIGLFTGALVVQILVALYFQKRTEETVRSPRIASRELRVLADMIEAFTREDLKAAWLLEVRSPWTHDGVGAPEALRRLASRVEWMDSDGNQLMPVISKPILLQIQLAFAIENWRAQFGAKVPRWLDALGKLEAMSALATYACEHPDDVMPEILPEGSPSKIEAEALGHPLIPESRAVRNNFAISAQQPLHIISGSNMSGKSTWMRAIGANVVLARAGAPVRARRFRTSSLEIGASIRTADSLQDGISRFYAEIKRLRQIAELATGKQPVLFLIDEVLSGTNSRDRQIGAAHIAKILVARGAIGLITTHDLALTEVAKEIQPPGANFHLEDQFIDGKLSFDYTLRPGVVEKSNALALMRSIGFDV